MPQTNPILGNRPKRRKAQNESPRIGTGKKQTSRQKGKKNAERELPGGTGRLLGVGIAAGVGFCRRVVAGRQGIAVNCVKNFPAVNWDLLGRFDA